MSEENKKKSNELYEKAQRRVIGSLLYDSSEASRVFQILAEDDFEEPSLELIYTAILDISRRNEEISPYSVAAQLEVTGNLAKVGGPPALYMLRDEGDRYLLEASIELYAKVVKDASAKHKIFNTLKEHQQLFTPDSGTPAADGVSELQAQLNEQLYSLSDGSAVQEISTSVDQYLELLELRRARTEENLEAGEGLQGIPSLVPSLNYYTGGWMPGQMITVGARTGIGKSIFAVNCAVAAAQAGKTVLFFSLEMSFEEIQDRILASISGVTLNKLKSGTLDEHEKQIIQDLKPTIEKMKIVIVTDPKVTIDSMRARALEQAQSEDGLDMIILDYLQLITTTGKHSSRQEALADTSRNTKIMAKQLEVPVMVLVQVNRESKDDENPVPRMSQIRESGAIAQDSDTVILIHREDSLDDSIPHTLLLLEKNRQGEADKTIRCHSNLANSLFREVTKARDIEVERVSDDDHSEAYEDIDLSDFSDFVDDDDDVDPDELF